MAEKKIVVQGAELQCKFSVDPKTDILKVLSQTKHYANDSKGEEKLIASDKDIGQTLQKNTFGNCKMQPNGSSYNPCQAVITKWSGFYEKITLSNKGKVLLEDSTATCPMGSPDCITVKNCGQKAEISKADMMKTNNSIMEMLNPLVNMADFKNTLTGTPEAQK